MSNPELTHQKPLGVKNYGSIPHFSFSRLGPGDHYCHEGQEDICTVSSKGRRVIVQIKLDGSNVGVARVGGELIPLGRAGYTAISSPYEMHHMFHHWALKNAHKYSFLKEGERVVGEWLAQAHGTKYDLWHDPFVAFDIFNNQNKRIVFADFIERIGDSLVTPFVFQNGKKHFSINDLNFALSQYDAAPYHAEIDPCEGAIYRVEDDAKKEVSFLCKFVKQTKQDGLYLKQDVWNWKPE